MVFWLVCNTSLYEFILFFDMRIEYVTSCQRDFNIRDWDPTWTVDLLNAFCPLGEFNKSKSKWGTGKR